MNRVFCGHCGNKTLKKVAVTVNDDGTLHMHFSRNPKVLNPRGLRVGGISPDNLRINDQGRTRESDVLWDPSTGVEAGRARVQGQLWLLPSFKRPEDKRRASLVTPLVESGARGLSVQAGRRV